ncbi:ArsR/SmtB family transcription factor [Deinococcus roseus]|uniref:HTH arsR-type domain-containing protein n=1 Tax=Deinococcus roseus TaxID=392414 RepID=A0ABQ2D582_9DEIO|nr:helix-turn-helix domain-containing protein [Deinococcus roseus]GGJ41057.1 hypothetical protein GCM10008938_28860 [Deinococcus roseus]
MATLEVPEKLNCNVLLTQTNQRILEACMLREHTLKELVEELHLEMSEVHYRVQQLIRAGILKVAREEKRAGRPIKYYAPTQQNFFLPFKDTVYNTVSDFVSQQMEPIMRRFIDLIFRNVPQVGEWGLSFGLQEKDGKFTTIFRQEGKHPEGLKGEEMQLRYRVLAMWQNLSLLPEDARSMQRELMDLYEKYRQKQNSDGEKHMLGLFFTPGDFQDD